MKTNEEYKWYLNTHIKIMKPESYNADKEEEYKMKVREWFKKKVGQKLLFRELLRTILRYIPKHLHNKLIEELDEENVIMDMRSLGQVLNINGVRSKKWLYVLKEGELRIGESFDWGEEAEEANIREEAEMNYAFLLEKCDQYLNITQMNIRSLKANNKEFLLNLKLLTIAISNFKTDLMPKHNNNTLKVKALRDNK
jgi:hypothetical protein